MKYGKMFGPDELRDFLTAVDNNLHSREQIVVCGGGSIALAFDIGETNDIDTYNSISRSVQRAAERVPEDIAVPFSHSTVAEGPENADERLLRVLPELKHLVVWAFEKHDITISKALRGWQKDYDAIRRLYDAIGLDEDTILERYITEARQTTGDQHVQDQKIIVLLDDLFGEEAGQRAKKALNWKSLREK